jgi:hypothetical protein
MCRKHARRCPVLLQIREEAVMEWAAAVTFEEVCRVWARLGGRTTLHRYGSQHFSELASRRWSGVAR